MTQDDLELIVLTVICAAATIVGIAVTGFWIVRNLQYWFS